MAIATNMRRGGKDKIPTSGKPSWTGDYPWDCAVYRANGRELGSRRLWNEPGGVAWQVKRPSRMLANSTSTKLPLEGAAMRRFASLVPWPYCFHCGNAGRQEECGRKKTAKTDRPKQINRGDLEGNMQLLNLWGERPEAVQRLYEAAYKILAARPDATFADLARDAEVQRLCAEAGVTHFGGPMLGAIRPDGAAVWLRTLRPAKVEVRVTVDGQEKTFGPVESTEQTDLTAVVAVTGLKPDTRYPYRVLGGRQADAVPRRGRSSPRRPWPAKARIAFGSCFHRWGLGNQRQAEAICKREPTALLVYGDIAVQDRDNHLGLHRADYLLRDFHPAWQRIAASVPVYATWDDHDYFNNDKWGLPKGYTEKDRQGVWEVFRYAWNNPSYGFNDERRGVFLRTRVGPCDVIMVDHRYFRTARRWRQRPGRQFPRPAADAVAGKPVARLQGAVHHPLLRHDVERLREQRQGFLGRIRSQGARADLQPDREAPDPRRAVDLGRPARGAGVPHPASLGLQFLRVRAGQPGRPRRRSAGHDPKWDAQLFGVAGKYAFGEFSFDATLSDPEVVFRLVHESGEVLYELKLTRSQLTPPEKAAASK